MSEHLPRRPDDPDRIGGYRITGRLGAGGQGVVYLAETDRGERRAIKVLHGRLLPDAAARERLRREVEAARRLPPFCTAKIYRLGLEDAGRPYIVSEYIPARSLHTLVERDGPLRDGALDQLAVGTITILIATHDAGVVHRDLTPHNVLVGPYGPRVIDFGIAGALPASTASATAATSTEPADPDAPDDPDDPGDASGTPDYVAPEQRSGEPAGAAADMFSWAVTMTYAATGRPARVRHGAAGPDIAALPVALREVVRRCLDERPDRRPTARAALDALLAAAPEQAVEIGAPEGRMRRDDVTLDRHRTPSPSPAATATERGRPARPGRPGRGDRGGRTGRTGGRRSLIAATALVVVAAGALGTIAAVRLTGGPSGSSEPPPGASARSRIVVGSANFPESALLGEIYAQVLEARGFTVTRKFNIGSREVYYDQIKSGAIDVLPEYNGALASFIGATKIDESSSATTTQLNRLLRRRLPSTLKILHSAAAEDKDSVTVTRQIADRYDLTSLTDLDGAAPELVMGGSPEFETRHQGLLGLRVRYQVNFKDYQPFSNGDTDTLVRSLKSGAIQAADLFTTDPAIRLNKFVVLQDPDQFFSAQNVTPLVYAAAVGDKARAALNDVSAELTTEDLLEMNTRVADRQDPATVAKQWLAQADIVG